LRRCLEEYKNKLRKEFDGGSLLTNKKKADKREAAGPPGRIVPVPATLCDAI
jgi:hypothetical protein